MKLQIELASQKHGFGMQGRLFQGGGGEGDLALT